MKNKHTNYLLPEFVSRSVGQYGNLGIVLIAFLLAIPAMVFGQSLDDFKSAAGSDGVSLIPFQDLRRDANSIAEDVQRRKNEVASFKYDTLEKQKNNHLKVIKKEKVIIERIQKEIQDFESDSSEVDFSTYISAFKEDIKKNESKITKILNGKIKAMNDNMAKAADSFDRLYQARAGLREYFDKALSKLSDAKSSPERYLGNNPSEDDKKRVKDYVDTIQDKIRSQMSTHKEEENNAKAMKQKYEDLIRKTE